MKNQIITGCLLLLLCMGCQKEEINPAANDYIVFGHFYGECQGESCVETFKLNRSDLFEDTKDIYPNFKDFKESNFIKLSPAQFEKAKDLLNNFPRELWQEQNKVIGEPDAGDWGGLYIEFKHRNKTRVWFLDLKKDNVPTKYLGFVNQVEAIIKQL